MPSHSQVVLKRRGSTSSHSYTWETISTYIPRKSTLKQARSSETSRRHSPTSGSSTAPYTFHVSLWHRLRNSHSLQRKTYRMVYPDKDLCGSSCASYYRCLLPLASLPMLSCLSWRISWRSGLCWILICAASSSPPPLMIHSSTCSMNGRKRRYNRSSIG